MSLEPPFPRLDSTVTIIDRRPNPQNKNLPNVKRFYERLSDDVRKAIVKQGIEKTNIVGGNDDQMIVDIPGTAVEEPSLHPVFTRGTRNTVLGGNKTFVVGDQIKRPAGQGQGSGSAPGKGSGSGSGTGTGAESSDTIRVVLNRKDFLDLYFADMKLPNLEKVSGKSREMSVQSAGHARQGAPHRMDAQRSARQAFARRLALGRPSAATLEAEQETLERMKARGTEDEVAEQAARVAGIEYKRRSIPWIDPVDLRYRRFEQVPKPNTSAVMFHMMDVSASMDAQRKLVAKAFALTVKLFLEREYKDVQHVFIRHADRAERCDEKTYFNDGMSGGTVASSAFVMTADIAKKEFPKNQWNRYLAYTGDGENAEHRDRIVPLISDLLDPGRGNFRYAVYLETLPANKPVTDFSRIFQSVGLVHPGKVDFQRAGDRTEVHPAIKRMFGIKPAARLPAAFGPASAGVSYAGPGF